MAEHDDVILVTPAGLVKLKAELERLLTRDRAEIANRIRESAEHGEFSEDNIELDEIKFEQAIVEGRIAELQSVLAIAQALTDEDIPAKSIGIGSIINLSNTKVKEKLKVTLVSSAEADPSTDYISDESPLGMALIGRQKGEIVTIQVPAGKISYEIKKIGKVLT